MLATGLIVAYGYALKPSWLVQRRPLRRLHDVNRLHGLMRSLLDAADLQHFYSPAALDPKASHQSGGFVLLSGVILVGMWWSASSS